MNRSIELPYGGKTIHFEVPEQNLMGLFAPAAAAISASEEELIEAAIKNPVASFQLSELVGPGMKVVIIADDKTRPTPVEKILPLLLDQLNEGGIKDYDVSVVYALGTHPPMTETEMRQRAGPVCDRIRLFNSEFKDPEGLTDCGCAADGVRVLVDKRVAKADFRIGVGSIMPHPECGWGGGGKILYPGVASEETVTTFHLSYAHVDWNSYGSDEAPVRLNMEKWVDTVGLDFIVNTIITADDSVYQAVAGHYVEAHRAGTRFGREIYSVEIDERAEVVIINSFRADEDFWLASKAIFAADLVVKDGGTVILVTPCPDGVGPHREYADYVGCDDWEDLARSAFAGELNEPIAVSAALAIAKMRQRFDIYIVSDGLDDEEVLKMQCTPFESVDAAVSSALAKHGPKAKIAILPDGISTLPIIKKK